MNQFPSLKGQQTVDNINFTDEEKRKIGKFFKHLTMKEPTYIQLTGLPPLKKKAYNNSWLPALITYTEVDKYGDNIKSSTTPPLISYPDFENNYIVYEPTQRPFSPSSLANLPKLPGVKGGSKSTGKTIQYHGKPRTVYVGPKGGKFIYTDASRKTKKYL